MSRGRISFSPEELALLEVYLQKQQTYLLKLQKMPLATKTKISTTYLKVLDKVKAGEAVGYSVKEKSFFIRCANECLEDLNKKSSILNASDWLSLSNEQLSVILKIDTCKDILTKCGYYKRKGALHRFNNTFRYRNVLSTIEKIRSSDTILLSKIGPNNFDKIAFINNRSEYFVFHFENQIHWHKMQFFSFNKSSPEEFARRQFSMITNKENAKNLLNKSERMFYQNEVFECVDNLLN